MAVSHRMYARALFQAARDQGKLDVVQQELGDFAAAVADVPQLRSLLANPELDPETKASVLEEILGDADVLVHNFLLLVVEKGRATEIEEIYRELDALVAAEQKRLNVELTTAFELSDEEADSILGKIEAASGRSVEAIRKVDPALIGGIVLQAGSLRVDASVKGRLSRLRHALSSGSL
jgi:F-type H+-transporting ATPase subunit delta